MNKKKIWAATALAGVAISLGTAGIASAHGFGGAKGKGLSTVLSGLVSKGTLTQAQADAINKGLDDLRATAQADRDAKRAADLKVITDTLGITAADLQTRLKAGDSLATIAGAKKDALITAIVAAKTKDIDAAVTAGKLTAAQATTMKANLKDRVTKMVEATPGKGPRMGGDNDGDMDGDMGMGPNLGPNMAPNTGTNGVPNLGMGNGFGGHGPRH